MTTKPIDRLHTAVRHRVEIADRWHGLKTPDEIFEFVAHHPDIAELEADPEIQHVMRGGT